MKPRLGPFGLAAFAGPPPRGAGLQPWPLLAIFPVTCLAEPHVEHQCQLRPLNPGVLWCCRSSEPTPQKSSLQLENTLPTSSWLLVDP